MEPGRQPRAGEAPAVSAAHHEYDGLIVSCADKYGIPPQYIKSQVFRESKGTYDPTAYRYELKSIDLDTVARKWTDYDWQRYDYSMYRFPRAGAGTNFTDEDISPRNQYSFIAAYTPSATWPYSCANYQTTDAHAYLWDLYEADDGWPEGSYPATVYPGHTAPCPPRQN
jgi:hypothetical protein